MPGPVFLRGETVTLRTIEDEDVSFLQQTVNDPEVRHGLSASEPMTAAAEREWLDSETGLDSDSAHLLVCADGERVGTVGLTAVATQPGSAELGYFLAPEAWGNGYATDAVRTITTYAFEERRLHRAYAKVLAGNGASQRVLEKAGFQREGTLRDHWFRDGRHEDVYVYGLLADETEQTG